MNIFLDIVNLRADGDAEFLLDAGAHLCGKIDDVLGRSVVGVHDDEGLKGPAGSGSMARKE